MKSRVQEEEGSILVFSVFAMISLLLFASMAIDVGCILTARNQLQSAVDASALSGATGLIVDQPEATQRAITTAGNNTVIEQAVGIDAGNINFPTSSQVQVQTSRAINLYFAKIIGMNTADVSAAATAELATIVSTNDFRPWAVPNMGWNPGDWVVIKAGSIGTAPATNSSFYYPICFPPMNRGNPDTGANVYRDNIINGSGYEVAIGDEIMVEPGNMQGPTHQGVGQLICQDPFASWDGSRVINSRFPGTSSPRIVKLPLYDPNDPPNLGRKSINTIGFASFLVVGMMGDDVMGIFMDKLSQGTFGSGNSMLKGTRLIM